VALAKWLEDSVGKLVAAGHSVAQIRDYTYLQFMAFLKIVDRQDAARRSSFVSDITSVVSGMYAKKGTNPLGEYLESFEKTYFEDGK
jgi:hypothetical protein